MAASNSRFVIVALFFALIGSTPVIANDEVVTMLSDEVASRLDRLEEKSSYCLKKKERTISDFLSSQELKSLELSREQLLTAVSFLSFRNSYACGRQELMEFAFSLKVLENSREEYGYETKDLEVIHETLMYPDTDYFELSLRYKALPKSTRDFFEKGIGNEPFNVVEAFEFIPRP